MASTFFSFPNPVNEKAARTVAVGVLTLAVITIVLGTAVDNGWLWLTALLFAGFVGRVLTGPKLSLLGQLATRVIAPRLGEPRMVAGPPKRFAQAIGFVVTGLATLFVALGLYGLAIVFLAMIVVAATLEGVFGYCIGCTIFGVLMRHGYISEEICASCADISSRIGLDVTTRREASGTLTG
ncbi:DUF4395 domain-containing protein [Jatrophihabitans sp.]|uniref:DUF4395 domain-containing protein n=1 Tax=Jatrophihabitans sp. TaxID=1932789 RepID=UPI0030C6C1EE|nr:transporter permease [Jatrophihabitans sp.]